MEEFFRWQIGTFGRAGSVCPGWSSEQDKKTWSHSRELSKVLPSTVREHYCQSDETSVPSRVASDNAAQVGGGGGGQRVPKPTPNSPPQALPMALCHHRQLRLYICRTSALTAFCVLALPSMAHLSVPTFKGNVSKLQIVEKKKKQQSATLHELRATSLWLARSLAGTQLRNVPTCALLVECAWRDA